jgi:membrane dipeptidase
LYNQILVNSVNFGDIVVKMVFFLLLLKIRFMVTRRNFIKNALLTSGGLLVLPQVQADWFTCADEEKWRKRADKIHNSILTLDSHCDTPLTILHGNIDMGIRNDTRETRTKIDFPRMKEGGLDASFFAVFLGQGNRNEAGNKKAKADALKIFSAIFEAVKKYPLLAEIAISPDDAYRIQKLGKRAIYIGIENGYPIGSDLNNIEEFYRLGARYITLCHSSNNDICDSSTDKNGPEHNGLSEFGKKVVNEMNRLGMMVDISHISDKAFYDVVALSKVPVIASHSSARAICNHPRNLDDQMLRSLKENGGVVQLCILSSYIRTPLPNPERDEAFKKLREKYGSFNDLSPEARSQASREWRQIDTDFPETPATISQAVDHIDHMVKVAGIDHVGIGTDFDGGGGIQGFYDISEAGNLTYELVKRGYSAKEIEKIWSGNLMRVFRDVEANKG